MENIRKIAKSVCLTLALGSIPVMNVMGESVNTVHLVSEQNIVTIKKTENDYLLLPVQDNAPEAKLYIIRNGQPANAAAVNVRLARERVDYYVPLDLSEYRGKDISIDIQGMSANALCWNALKLSDTFDMTNREKFRPLYHHTPAYGWMNDPNGMFYKDGVYHLYYQYNPYGSTWGNMTWGHSTSTDLVDWEFQGEAIVPDAWGAIFSGSCVVDYENTAGFGKGAVVAFYTSAKPTPWGDSQSQSMAYSLDNGKTFTKYEHNPIVVSAERDFRDPKVFWYAPGKHWVMMLAVGQEMWIYSSPNLKDWKKESTFGLMQGAHGGVWECPDLVELPVEGTKEKKWVLICNINPGGPFGGSAAQYFVGTFDGKQFVNEYPTQTKWLDWGKDNYATVTWSNAPEGRCIAIGWMSNWQYQGVLPTMQYRGANTIARDLTLYRQGKDVFLKSAPSPEIEKARTEVQKVSSFRVDDRKEVEILSGNHQGAYEIVLELKNAGARKMGFCLMNEGGEEVKMYYDGISKQFVMDRTQSGLTSFSRDFPAVTAAPAEVEGTVHVRLFVDRSSIEAFGEGGKFVMTNRVFPEQPYTKLVFYAEDGSYTVRSLQIHGLK